MIILREIYCEILTQKSLVLQPKELTVCVRVCEHTCAEFPAIYVSFISHKCLRSLKRLENELTLLT
jgi:hypothetical protein